MDLRLQDLDDHRKLSAQVASDLRTLGALAERLDLAEVGERTEELLDRLEDQVFRVAVVGEFKRGKSTLINALLGREVLPADVLPCSATLNRVTYGLEPSVELVFRSAEGEAPKRETIGIDELEAWVTKLTPESEKQAADVAEAIVRYPVGFCRDKADIIDTPGLNDDRAMTDVTMGVLPTCDAAILVILAQSPFSGYEAEFLNRLLTHDLGRVLFVVNRMDEIRRPQDKQRILDVVQQRIEKAVLSKAAELYGEGTTEHQDFVARLGTPRVFGVSGGVALDAKLDDDAEALAGSGFPEFEAHLERFLTLERGLVSLLVLTEGAASAAAKLQQQANIRRSALAMGSDDFEATWQTNLTRLEVLRGDYAAELKRLDRASEDLCQALAPQARGVPKALRSAAQAHIAAAELSPEDVDKEHIEATQKRILDGLGPALQDAARREGEKITLEVEKGMAAELSRLAEAGAQMAERLREIEFDFTRPDQDESVAPELLAGGLIGLGGWLFGGVLGGGFAGYREAGLKGAAVGGASGLALGFGTVFGVFSLAVALGLPLTWPVTLPALALSGLAAAFGGRKIVKAVFKEERVQRFRDRLTEAVLEDLDKQAPETGRSLVAALDAQIAEAFGAIRKQVEAELGGAIASTRSTLDTLRTQRARSAAQSERDQAELDRDAARANEIEARARSLHRMLRNTSTGANA